MMRAARSADEMVPAAYDGLGEQARFISAVGEGLSDAEEGRLSDHADVVAMMNAQFGNSEG